MLVSAKEMLQKARDGKYAVGQFNINNLEWTKAILLTAQEQNSPVILGVSEGGGTTPGSGRRRFRKDARPDTPDCVFNRGKTGGAVEYHGDHIYQ